MDNRLVELDVARVVMEATSEYWKPVFYLSETHGLEPWLVNARLTRAFIASTLGPSPQRYPRIPHLLGGRL